MSNNVRAAVICLVACVWTANFVAPIFIEGYIPPPEVHLVFLAVLAFLGLGYQHRSGDQQPKSDGNWRPADTQPGVEPHALSRLPDMTHDDQPADDQRLRNEPQDHRER